MRLGWRSAYLDQARSDYEVFHFLLKQGNTIPYCHVLHYLQMSTEKLAKAFLTDHTPARPARTHNAFVKFVRVAGSRPEMQRICQFSRTIDFKRYVNSLLPLAQAVEDLSPEGSDHPNPEYPWEATGIILSPLGYHFSLLHPTTPMMIKLLEFVQNCFKLE